MAEAARTSAIPLADDADALSRLSLQLWETLQAIRVVPAGCLFQRLTRVARDAARIEGRDVEVVTLGDETGIDRTVQDKAFEPLLHVVRNAVGHGIEPAEDRIKAGKPASGRVTLRARREGNTLVLSVQDDGRGLDYAAIAAKGRRLGLIGAGEEPSLERLNALVFQAGFSTRQEANAISGRGVGMDVVAQEVGLLRGTIALASEPGRRHHADDPPAREALAGAGDGRPRRRPGLRPPLRMHRAGGPVRARDPRGDRGGCHGPGPRAPGPADRREGGARALVPPPRFVS